MDLISAKFLLVGVVALVVLGPERLPGALRTSGRMLAEFRRISAGLRDEARSALDATGLAEPLRDLGEPVRQFRSATTTVRSSPGGWLTTAVGTGANTFSGDTPAAPVVERDATCPTAPGPVPSPAMPELN